jgi:hypothetical protein
MVDLTPPRTENGPNSGLQWRVSIGLYDIQNNQTKPGKHETRDIPCHRLLE